MFAVVLFRHDETVGIVSSAWLTKQKTAAFWPTVIRPEKLKSLAKSALEPGPTWMLYGVRVLYETGELMDWRVLWKYVLLVAGRSWIIPFVFFRNHKHCMLQTLTKRRTRSCVLQNSRRTWRLRMTMNLPPSGVYGEIRCRPSLFMLWSKLHQ